MKKNTGYREMLRDRCPKVVNYALRWCKAKEAWLNHVYKNWIWIYASNEERLKATKDVLGLNKPHKQFIFADTIDWDNLTSEDKSLWETVDSWVSWFQQRYMYIENDYSVSKKVGKPITEIKLEIMSKYLGWMCPTVEDDAQKREEKNKYINLFCDFLIDCFENRI